MTSESNKTETDVNELEKRIWGFSIINRENYENFIEINNKFESK